MNKRKSFRIRRSLKWMAFAASLLILIADAVAWQWEITWRHDGLLLSLRDGCLECDIFPRKTGLNGLYIDQNTIDRTLFAWPAITYFANRFSGSLHSRIGISLGMALVTTGLITGYLWYLDCRHKPPFHCRKCGYNLTGNISGVCPECGAKVSEREGGASGTSPRSRLP